MEKIWKDKTVFIIGGGSSIPTEFGIPETLVEDVKQHRLPVSEFSKYMKPLHRKKVVGINAAYMLGQWLNFIFFADEMFWRKNQEGLRAHKAQLVSCNSRFERVPDKDVLYLQKDREKQMGIHSNPTKVSWNHSSGAAAISLCNHLGAKKIILIGFDMKAPKGQTHYHNEYNWIKTLPPYEKYLLGFKRIANDAKALGIEIINASPDSAIKEFKKCAVEDILKGVKRRK